MHEALEDFYLITSSVEEENWLEVYADLKKKIKIMDELFLSLLQDFVNQYNSIKLRLLKSQ